MKVFISWSGNVSHEVALALKEWLPNVIQSVDPFVSSEDIEKGARWFPEIGAQLETNFGILCLTPENLVAPWLLFEAGALSKALDQARVSPFLIGVSKADVTGPLAQFQMTEFSSGDVKKLVAAINNAQKDEAQRLPEPKLGAAFDKWWPDLDKQISALVKEAVAPKVAAVPPRKDRDILEEILNTSRGVSQEIQSHGHILLKLASLIEAVEVTRNPFGTPFGTRSDPFNPGITDFFGLHRPSKPAKGLIASAMAEKMYEQQLEELNKEKEKTAQSAKDSSEKGGDPKK